LTMLAKEKGMSNLKVFLILLLVFVVVHVGIKLVPMYITAETMKDEMSTKSRFAQTLKDDEITLSLEKKAKELGLPLKQEDFKLVRDDAGQRIKVSTAWDVEIHFFFDIYPPYTVRTFHFAPVIDEAYTTKF